MLFRFATRNINKSNKMIICFRFLLKQCLYWPLYQSQLLCTSCDQRTISHIWQATVEQRLWTSDRSNKQNPWPTTEIEAVWSLEVKGPANVLLSFITHLKQKCNESISLFFYMLYPKSPLNVPVTELHFFAPVLH